MAVFTFVHPQRQPLCVPNGRSGRFAAKDISILGQRKRLDREAPLSSLCFLLRVRILRASPGGGIARGRIRSPAGEPYLLKQSTELFPRAGFPISSSEPKKKRANQMIYSRFGGGGRIRTIEAKRSRFTVCPLWPLGNSPRYEILFCLNGAGRRTRTPDLLITNQLLYQLSYTGGSNRTRLL